VFDWVKRIFHSEEAKQTQTEFELALAEARMRGRDLHSAAQQLREARESIHKRAKALDVEANKAKIFVLEETPAKDRASGEIESTT
jgi:hypothetical protein